ncbi:MAG: MtrB/PioB family outer membrane beta-barrel protein [Deltaproteobacteria bacterium]|nr:MtrB/PioB family outer membrane beta-barrel protein [Deltaproteobacteria bacterium]
MKQSRLWLLALLTVLTFVAATTAMAEEGAGHLTGSWELGMSGINTDDNAARVNEYGSVRQEDGVSLAPQLDLEFEKGGFILELESETMGPRDQMHEISIDAGRVFKFESELSVLEHTKDHETLSQMGATARDDGGPSQPNVTTDKIFADLLRANDDFATSKIGGSGPWIGNARFDGLTPAEAADLLESDYNQEVNSNYVVTRREWKNEASLTIPALPNVTLNAGVRIETREGMEQSISLAKCAGCHISAVGKDIDERTEDFTVGLTGKFGLLTVEYEYLTRNFNEDADAASRYYLAAGKGHLIDQGQEDEFGRTPDSEKESHLLKARIDLPNNTSITGSYVKADIESSKNDTQDGYVLLEGNELQTEYESFALKLATKFGKNISLSLRGRLYEIEADNNVIYIADRDGQTLPFDSEQDFVSAEEREVTEFGTDVVIRLAKATTLRLGYEYEEIEREEGEELGETETHTFKAALKARVSSELSGRISYQYQDIDDSFHGAHVGIAQVTGTSDGFDSGLMFFDTNDYNGGDPTNKTWYWDAVYPNRELTSTNQADEVHEAKFSSTWSPSANMAATVFMRFRYEENDDVEYEQTTFVPGASFWYAPSDKLNLTMSYTFNNQDTENRVCVGWYHG